MYVEAFMNRTDISQRLASGQIFGNTQISAFLLKMDIEYGDILLLILTLFFGQFVLPVRGEEIRGCLINTDKLPI